MVVRARLLAVPLLFLLLPGCSSPADPALPLTEQPLADDATPVQDSASRASQYAEPQIVLLARDNVNAALAIVGAGCEVDAAQWEIERNGHRIQNHTRKLVVSADVQGAFTGFRFGYSVDGGPFVWTDDLGVGAHVLEFPVPADLVETGGHQWTFGGRFGNHDAPGCPAAYSGRVDIIVEGHPAP